MDDFSPIAEAITEYLGERCDDFNPDCRTCMAWKAYDRIATLEAQLAARTGAVKVKPLEWSDHPAGGEQALGAGLGLYRVHSNGDAWYLAPDYMGMGGKAAAQADYERRILSALEPAPEAQLAAHIVALEAENNRLSGLADGYGKLDADFAIAERRIAALEAENKRLRKALEPFAEASAYHMAFDDERPVRADGDVLVKHLRAARHALEGGE